VPQWRIVRKVQDGLTTDVLYGFLTTDPNDLVKPIHEKAMPMLLLSKEETDTWMRGPWPAVCQLTRSSSPRANRTDPRSSRHPKSRWNRAVCFDA
jgi:putative SOS response-associated peptidase YedK